MMIFVVRKKEELITLPDASSVSTALSVQPVDGAPHLFSARFCVVSRFSCLIPVVVCSKHHHTEDTFLVAF